jgi:hypothetical protein
MGIFYGTSRKLLKTLQNLLLGRHNFPLQINFTFCSLLSISFDLFFLSGFFNKLTERPKAQNCQTDLMKMKIKSLKKISNSRRTKFWNYEPRSFSKLYLKPPPKNSKKKRFQNNLNRTEKSDLMTLKFNKKKPLILSQKADIMIEKAPPNEKFLAIQFGKRKK